MKKVFAMSLALMLAATSLAGCGGRSTESISTSEATNGTTGDQVEIRFSWWGNEARHEATLQAIDAYEAQNPGVKIVAEYSSYDGYQDKLMAQVSGGNAPDIFTCTAEWYPALYKANAMCALDDKVDWSNYDEATLESCSYNGNIYGACVSQNAYGVYYNKTLAEQYGVEIPEGDYTWDDFVKLLEEAYVKSDGAVYGMSDPRAVGGVVQFFGYTYLQKPEPYMWDNEKLTITAEDMTAYLKFIENMPEGCLLPPDESFGVDTFTASPVAQEQTMFELGSIGSFAPVQAQTQDELGIMQLPVGPNGEVANESRPGLILSVYQNSKVADEAAKFIDWFVNSTEAAKILKMTRGVLPTSVQRKALMEDTSILSPTDIAIMDAVNKAFESNLHTFLPGPVGADQVRDTTAKLIGQEHAFGQLTAEEAGEKFMVEAEKVLSSY